ncbi:hypothetical protein ACFSTC_33720 [Nonomuraea ferruginea]
MREVIFERLLPAPVNGRGERPKGVRRWVNIADKDDIAAIPPALAELLHRRRRRGAGQPRLD